VQRSSACTRAVCAICTLFFGHALTNSIVSSCPNARDCCFVGASGSPRLPESRLQLRWPRADTCVCAVDQDVLTDLSGFWDDAAGGVVEISQEGDVFTARNPAQLWSPARGVIAGNTLTLVGIQGKVVYRRSEPPVIVWSNGFSWTRRPLDPWAVLGLSPGTAMDDVKLQYRKLAAAEHPDRNPGDRAAAVRFQRISDAYQELIKGGGALPQEQPVSQAAKYNSKGWVEALRSMGLSERDTNLLLGARGILGNVSVIGTAIVLLVVCVIVADSNMMSPIPEMYSQAELNAMAREEKLAQI